MPETCWVRPFPARLRNTVASWLIGSSASAVGKAAEPLRWGCRERGCDAAMRPCPSQLRGPLLCWLEEVLCPTHFPGTSPFPGTLRSHKQTRLSEAWGCRCD